MEGPEQASLGAYARVIAGQSPDGQFYNQDGSGMPFYQGKRDFGDWELQPPTKWTTQVTKEALPGDILMSVRAPVGPVNFTREKVCIGRGLAAIRCRNGMDPEFLFYQLLGMQDRIAGKEGAVFASINKAEIESLPIVAPPIPEQRRIVAIFDEAFETIATAKANTEKNLQNAREVFEASLQYTFSVAPEGVDPTTLGAVCRFVGGSQPPKSEFITEPRAGYVRLIQIRDYKSDAKAVYIPKLLARRFCAPDDVMIGRYGPPLFQILRGLDGAYNVALMKAAPDERALSKGYLYYFLRNRDILNYIIASSARAAGQIGLNKETIEPYPIYVPCLETQAETVRRIEQLEAATQALVRTCGRKLATLDELKKSLLHQAFTGQLTAKSTDQQLKAVA